MKNLTLFSMLSCLAMHTAEAAEPRTFSDGTVDVSVLVDGPWQSNDTVVALVMEEILALTRGEFDVRFPEDKRVTAEWTGKSVEAGLEAMLADPEVDVVLAMGTIASHLAANHEGLDKPVFAPFVLDPEIEGTVRAGPGSGIDNLAYLTLPSTFATELGVFADIVDFEHVAVLTNGPLNATLPSDFAGTFQQLAGNDVKVDVIPVGFEAAAVIDALPPGVDAVYSFPLIHMPNDEFDKLAAGLIEHKLPSFSSFGRADVERGLLAGTGQDTLLPNITRKLALNVQRYLLGEEMSDLPVTFNSRAQLAINLDTARAIGLSVRWEVLAEAERIHKAPTQTELLTLDAAVSGALDANLDLEAGAREVAVGEQETREALASLLPGLSVSALAATIDKDRAEASMGSATQYFGSTTVTATQPLIVEPAIAGLGAIRDLQRSREHTQAGRRADIILEAVTSYINVLRARTFEELQQDNLRVTRRNLDLARVRQRIGVAGPSEIYRWEVQIALARKSSLQAFYSRKLTEVALNRVLHRPLSTSVNLVELGITDAGLIANERQILEYIDDPVSFQTFSDFAVERGLAAAPELLAFAEVISAQERLHRSARRAYWAPIVAAEAKLTQNLLEEGAGSDGGLDLSALGVPALPVADDTDWQLGLSASLPVFSGGARRAAVSRTAEEAGKTRVQRDALAERLEQRIRSGVFAELSALYATRHARDAAVAAEATLEVATDAYTVGEISILELLDAQQSSLQVDLGLIDAQYAFQLALVEVMRATNDYSFLNSQQVEAAWFAELDAWFAERGVTP